MLRQKGSKMMAAAVAGGLALMAVSVSAAQADDWHGNGHGWGHKKHWNGGGWDGPPRVIVRNGYYYAPPPVYYAPPPPPVYYEAPPPVYYAPPPVYYAPPPLVSLQFRL